ncbi:CDP-glycerol glycerophosphotransferase family protein [Streptomyces sp. NPDC059479]|uniref:bifunctional glycosyltransferase/CDP-glycerol:glycerophosphate glycerophosphotransferase n=1 Tax=Streptomyces sp. NPDC059479 TaxID=3346848 RepID=UPI00369CE533
MPRFSVIVSAYMVQAYLTECLESVLTQSYDDLELIAVDDRSPDACGTLIGESAARDDRIIAVRLPEHSGAGPARRAGLARATGDHVIFLDGTDTLVPDALRSIADRLKETDGPDVLVYGHVRARWSGETVRDTTRPTRPQGRPQGPGSPLTEEGPAPFRLTDRPALLTWELAGSQLACRREFLVREGFASPAGPSASHGDSAWICTALMTAASIVTLDRVCVREREPYRIPGQRLLPGASRDVVPDGSGQLDLFEPYDRLFALVDTRPELARWRPVLHRRMLDAFGHLAAMNGAATNGALKHGVWTGGEWKHGDRVEFFRRARAHHRRYRVPGADRRTEHLLLRLGAHRTYRMLRFADRLRRRLGRAAAGLFRTVRAVALRLHYGIQRRLPLRADRAVFTAYAPGVRGSQGGPNSRSGYGGYTGNPAAIEETVRELAPHIRTAWIADPVHQHTIPTGTRRLRPGSFAHWTALARSRYLVGDTGFDARLVKRRGQILLQTHRGTPLASTGLDLLDRPAAARDTDFGHLLADATRWDYSLSANRHSTLIHERTRPSTATTLEYGSPRTDVFHRATASDVARLRETLGIPEGFTAVLYAPAYRDYRYSQRTALDLERVVRSLGPRHVLLARAHPAYGAPLPHAPHPRILDVSDHPSVETLCLASDVLLTDHSSLMCDYAVLDRPIVLHCDDREAFEAARGLYVDPLVFPPGVVARDEDELIDIFTSGHWRGSRSAQVRTAFRARFCPYDDGRAAERVVRHVFLGEPAGLPVPLPLEERTPALLPGRV